MPAKHISFITQYYVYVSHINQQIMPAAPYLLKTVCVLDIESLLYYQNYEVQLST